MTLYVTFSSIFVYSVFLLLALSFFPVSSKTRVKGERITYSVGPYTHFVQANAPKCQAINSEILTNEQLFPYLKSQNVDEETIGIIREVLFVKKKNFYTFENIVLQSDVHLKLITGTAERLDDDSFKISLAKGEISGKLQQKTKVITLCKYKRRFCIFKKKKCYDEEHALALNQDELGKSQNYLLSLLQNECLKEMRQISRNEL